METKSELNNLQFAMDRYVELHGHTPEAYAKVTDVLHKWEYMIDLATRRALDELFYNELPDNVIPLQRRPVSPENAS